MAGGADRSDRSSGTPAAIDGEPDSNRTSGVELDGLRALRERASRDRARRGSGEFSAGAQRAVALLARASNDNAAVPAHDVIVLDDLVPVAHDTPASEREWTSGSRLYREAASDAEWFIEPLELDHAINAVRAAKLDEEMGVCVGDLKVAVDTSGRAYLATRNDHHFAADPQRLFDATQSASNGVHDGFVGDVVLGNRSVLGRDGAGIKFSRDDGTARRESFKGALSFREPGGKKLPAEFGPKAAELSDMLDIRVEPRCAKVFSSVSRTHIQSGLQRAMDLPPDTIGNVLASYTPIREEDVAGTVALLMQRRESVADTMRVRPAPVAPFRRAHVPRLNPIIERVRRGELKGREALRVVLDHFPEAKFHGSRNRGIKIFHPRVPDNIPLQGGIEPVFYKRGYVWVTPSPDLAIFCASMRGRGRAGWRSEPDDQGRVRHVFGASPETIARVLDPAEPPGCVYVFLGDFEIDPGMVGEYRSARAIVPCLSIEVTVRDLPFAVESLPVTINLADARYSGDGWQAEEPVDSDMWLGPPVLDRRMLYRDIEIASKALNKQLVLGKWTIRVEKADVIARRNGIARLVPFISRSRKEGPFLMTIEGKRVLFVNARSGFAVDDVMRLARRASA
jgi:hypothetical protein